MIRGPKKIGLLDHTGNGNLGDDATQTAVMDNIKKRWPDSVICGFSMNPSDTQSRHGIPSYAIRRSTWRLPYQNKNSEAGFKNKVKSALSEHRIFLGVLRTINAVAIQKPRNVFSEIMFLARSFAIMRTFDILIISGGGQLLDSWGGPWAFPYTIFKWILLGKLSGVKCYFLNVGAGPLQHPLSKFLVKRALFLADYVSFRDQKSKALVNEIGFVGECQTSPDCVYGLDVCQFNTSRIRMRDEPVVGISPMPYCDPSRYYIRDQLAYDSYIRKLALFGSWLSHRCGLTLFSTEVWFDSKAIDDLDLTLKKLPEMDVERLLIHGPITNTEELLSQMSSMDYIITSRFHGVIFAHLMNIPVVALSPHPKVATLMNNLGLSEYCLDIDTVDPVLLTATFTRMVNNKDDIKVRMAEKATLYKNALTRQFNQLFLEGAK
jgi:polysaccharide pyruvyl transferase WcaK-like protein